MLDSKLKMHLQSSLATKVAGSILTCINISTASRLKDCLSSLNSLDSVLSIVSSFGPHSTRKLLIKWKELCKGPQRWSWDGAHAL